MATYNYIARDSEGTRKEGIKEAACPTDVLGWLREQGLTPISVKGISARADKKARQPRHRKRIKSADMAALCWQLSTMAEGGIPLTTALETISEDIENLRLQEVLQRVLESMQKGETFSESISEFPRAFNKLACAMILAGETGGSLPISLRRLAEHFDTRDKLGKKVKGAMAYPVFVLVFITLIVIFIMAFIIPRFRTIFDTFGGELPGFTRAFMGFYDIVRYNLIYIIGFISLIIISTVLAYTKTRKGHYLINKIFLALPFFGKISTQSFITMFCRTMATLLTAGVSVLEVFDILATMTNNHITQAAIVRSKDHIVAGESIFSGMAATGFFPNMVIKMIQVGEESGSLSKVLNRTADYYERKVDATITTLMSMLEPIMIVIVGGIVLMVVLALYLPIFSMNA